MLLIREPVGPFLAIVACPFVVERFGLRGLRRLLIVGSTCIALGIVVHEANHWYLQRDPAWAEFREYNELRGRIHRTAREAYLMEAAPSVGWTKNDAEMFHNWYFADPEVFGSLSKMRISTITCRCWLKRMLSRDMHLSAGAICFCQGF